MYTPFKTNLRRTLSCFLLANTLGIGAVSAQTTPASAAPSQLPKADPRFTSKTDIKDIHKLDLVAAVLPITGNCPVLLVTGCSSSGGPTFPTLGLIPLTGGKLGAGQVSISNARYDR